MKKHRKTNAVSRRSFLSSGAAATAAVALYPVSVGYTANKTGTGITQGLNSVIAGVQMGTITYSFRSMPDGSALDMLRYCVQSGINTIEFMGSPAEIYAGIPLGPGADAAMIKENIGGAATSRDLDFSNMSIERAGGWGSFPGSEAQRAWRESVPITKFEELRKIYNDAGVEIHMLKLSPATWSDGEIDYAFRVGKALGAQALSDELDWVEGAVGRLASFAEKHDMMVAFHVHQQFGFEDFSVDPYLAISPAVMLNFDAGHYYGATGLNPADYIERYHDRIFSIHLKDKTGPDTDPPNTNQVWGQGETPLEDVLLLLKAHTGEKDWPKYADIELEYPVPAWSNPVKEVRTCLNYAKQILLCS